MVPGVDPKILKGRFRGVQEKGNLKHLFAYQQAFLTKGRGCLWCYHVLTSVMKQNSIK